MLKLTTWLCWALAAAALAAAGCGGPPPYELTDIDPDERQLGICRRDGVTCQVATADGQELQIAVVDINETANPTTRVFFPGGPGQDVTRAAGFEPARVAGDADRVVVIGEPGAAVPVTDECRAAAIGYLEALPGTTETKDDAAKHLAEICSDDLAARAWTGDLLVAVADVVADADEVVASSFGARILAAIDTGDASLRRVLATAPAPGADTYPLQRLTAERSAALTGIACATGEVCAEDRTADWRYRFALINSGYAWYANKSFYESYSGSGDETEQTLRAARSLFFADDGGHVDDQFVSFLAITCAAYTLDVDDDQERSPLGQAVADVFRPCAFVAPLVPSLPDNEVDTGAAVVCVGFSPVDPVSTGPMAHSLRFSGETATIETGDVPPGHLPTVVLERLEARSECQSTDG